MKQAKVLNGKEYKRLLSAAKMTRHADRNRLAVVLSFGVGLRACEIAAITVGDVVDSKGNVKSQATLKSHQTKGKKSHVIFLSDAVQDEIKKYLDKYSYRIKSHKDALLTPQKGGAFTSQTIQDLFRSLFQSVGLDDCSSHSGRRTLLTNASNAGINIRTIQAIARHSHLNTTARYISVTDTQIKNAVNLISV